MQDSPSTGKVRVKVDVQTPEKYQEPTRVTVKVKDENDNRTDRYRIAIHEAGHALVAYLQGGELNEATIEPTEEYQGQVWSEGPAFDGVDFEHEDARDKLRTLHAGGEAERLVFGDGEPSAYDRRGITALGINHAPLNENGVRDTSVFAEEAYEMLRENRAALEALADFLLEKETLSGQQAETFLDDQVE